MFICLEHLCSVVSDSQWPHRLLCPLDSPGKNTGSGLPCPTLGDLPDSGIKPKSSGSPALQADSSPTEPSRKPNIIYSTYIYLLRAFIILNVINMCVWSIQHIHLKSSLTSSTSGILLESCHFTTLNFPLLKTPKAHSLVPISFHSRPLIKLSHGTGSSLSLWLLHSLLILPLLLFHLDFMIHCLSPSLARIISHPAPVSVVWTGKIQHPINPLLSLLYSSPRSEQCHRITQWGRLITANNDGLWSSASYSILPRNPSHVLLSLYSQFSTMGVSSLFSDLLCTQFLVSPNMISFPTPKRTQNFSGRKLLFKMICDSSLPVLLASLGICIFFLSLICLLFIW